MIILNSFKGKPFMEHITLDGLDNRLICEEGGSKLVEG